MGLTLVVACAENRVIGRAGGLPWRLPDDLRRFRRLTTGHAVVMGRRTWESIGRPLPERRNLVVTSRALEAPGVEAHASLDAALAAVADDDPEPCVIGGEALYAAALPAATRIERTLVHAEPEGDAFFPEVDWRAWRRTAAERHEADARHALAFTFETWVRS
ncbi:MAG TPA: dihydrofolate reductase [Myxococcota bacterium]|nr:dihydrofolate reductase [Myxococcota bacterium]